MKEVWDGQSKFEISKGLLVSSLDSIQRLHPNTEFGIRLFGHQSSRGVQNCTDSKLEVPFGKHSGAAIKIALDKITPQGWTPITYTLKLSAEDFPKEDNVTNALILITDGLETCGGDPCEAGKALIDKKISLKPFIIGLGLGVDKKRYFDCVGTYYDASSAPVFKQVLNTIVKQTLNPTTSQVNILNEFGKATETDVTVSLFDNYSKNLLYNFVHTLDQNGLPDTLNLNPAGTYDITIHTIPPVVKTDIELTPGIHNIISLKAPQGILKLSIRKDTKQSSIQCIVRQSGDPKTLYVQDCNTFKKYHVGTYDVEILTLPKTIVKGVRLKQSTTEEIVIERAGTLAITSHDMGIASIYYQNSWQWERVYEFKKLSAKETIRLQPGKYRVVYRLNDNKNANFTREQAFDIYSGTVTSVRF